MIFFGKLLPLNLRPDVEIVLPFSNIPLASGCMPDILMAI